jgi:hypothetical protein
LNLPLFAAGALAAGLGIGLLPTRVHGQIAVTNQGYVPFSEAPINYRAAVNDPVAQLQRRLDAGETTSGGSQNSYLTSCSRTCTSGQLTDTGLLKDEFSIQEDFTGHAARALLQRRRLRRQGARRQGN